MNRTEYETRRRALRAQLRPAWPTADETFKQPLRTGHCRDQVVTAQAELRRLTGDALPRQTERQFLIEWRAKAIRQRLAKRQAIKALRDAGADESAIQQAWFSMNEYGGKPEHYLRVAAKMIEAKA